MTSTALWRRLDTPGHDACRVSKTDDGWQLQGVAVFLHELGPAQIEYVVACDSAWRSRTGGVRGWIAHESWDLRIERTAAGTWRLNDMSVDGLEHCLDVDFGFT